MKKVITPLFKSVLIELGSIALKAAADTDTGIHKNIWTGITLITSNEEIKDIMKIVKSVEDLDLLMKNVTETMFLGTH